MKQLNLIAVPNGAFTLEEAIKEPILQEAIQKIKCFKGTTTTENIKAFLAAYQIIDTLTQMRNQGMDLSQLNGQEFKASMTMAIEVGYDSIMKTFTNHERKMLHELVRKASVH